MRFALTTLLLIAACTGASPTSTGTVCPDPDPGTLTYDNFGKPFMDSYCTRCHSSQLEGSQRKGAPSFHDFDSLFGIKAVSMHIDETTGSGPAATNTGMPPDGPKPTKAEREMLAQWIACGMPQ